MQPALALDIAASAQCRQTEVLGDPLRPAHSQAVGTRLQCIGGAGREQRHEGSKRGWHVSAAPRRVEFN